MSTARVDFTRAAAERIANVVRVVEGTIDEASPLRFGKVVDTPGGSSLKLGKVTAAWNKNSLRHVVVYSGGTALSETSATPPVTLENCVNKFADVQADRWVMVGRTNGRWYLVSAEC